MSKQMRQNWISKPADKNKRKNFSLSAWHSKHKLFVTWNDSEKKTCWFEAIEILVVE